METVGSLTAIGACLGTLIMALPLSLHNASPVPFRRAGSPSARTFVPVLSRFASLGEIDCQLAC